MFLLRIPQKFITPKICLCIVRPVTIQRFSGISSSTSEVGMMTKLVLLVVEKYEVQRWVGACAGIIDIHSMKMMCLFRICWV